jgi:hypothetical protein
MNSTISSIKLTQKQSGIVCTLMYFDVFNYPLNLKEIIKFSNSKVEDETQLLSDIQELCTLHLVFCFNQFYSLQNNPQLVDKRLKGNRIAENYLSIAYKNAKLIGAFPFVRAVGISGSLSKGYMDESGDIDYFIITEAGRLWIARTLLILYKKIFLFNSRKFFCVNYFIDNQHLEIPDKNLFTATEINTLIPAYNTSLFASFFLENKWTEEFLPNKMPTELIQENSIYHALKSAIEKRLNKKFGDKLDTYFMKITLNKWKSKFKHIKEHDFELALRSRKYVSKHHPQGFQQKVLSAIASKKQAFEKENNIQLNP